MKCFKTTLLAMTLGLIMTTTGMTSITTANEASITDRSFGTFEGQPVSLFKLVNQSGMTAEISDYGGIVVSLKTADRDGKFEDVVLGYDDFKAYQDDQGFFGAITGRYANRIAKGQFSIDGDSYQLATNNGPNHLHGGNRGFNKRMWKPTARMHDGQPQLQLQYTSPDGEEGFPGNLNVTVTYTLTEDNGLQIHYHATTDQPTLCNLTHHGYWNIGGPTSTSILDQELRLDCDQFTPIDETSIPTGELRDVTATPFDFRTTNKIGERIDADNPQLKIGRGYDHNFVIDGDAGTLRPVARLHDKKSGRVMELLTTDVGVQFYTGNFFDGKAIGKNNCPMTHRIALCLECQRFPDSPNHANFPSATLRPGEVYEKTTVYRFSVEKR
ncbi:aldose 1-epimerase [Neorhodopirellula lusitana]|uniref:Aldose 1-epimerase n=1 Tax=Neorhodopirellula lusitana TaxID=445327 RepID=A0ABY1QBE6_9BACT|nr:aldose epimerase family protein [Neorhodopirellula lusitana]SMP61944.1 aldose 1-epimerase [Neorhodopirellula lusitana]